MASSVSRPSAKLLVTARGTSASAANNASSAPRINRNRFIASHLPDAELPENAGRAQRQGKNQQHESRRFAPAAAEIKTREVLERAQKQTDEHHTETGIETGHHRH